MAKNDYVPLFETRPIKGRILFRLFAASILVGICFIFIYRVRFFPVGSGKVERWTWIGLFLAELWFSFYWFLTTVCRWNPVNRFPYKDRLSQRYFIHIAYYKIMLFIIEAIPTLKLHNILKKNNKSII